MARRRNATAALRRAKVMQAGLDSAASGLDLGGGISATALQAKITELDQKIALFNKTAADLETQADALDDLDTALEDFNTRLLSGVASRFGRDSTEYQAVGGTRKSERKPRSKPVDKPAA